MATGEVLRPPTSQYPLGSRVTRKQELSVSVHRNIEHSASNGSFSRQAPTSRRDDTEQSERATAEESSRRSSTATARSSSSSSASTTYESAANTESQSVGVAGDTDRVMDEFRAKTYDLVLAFLYDRIVKRAHLPFPRSNIREFDDSFSRVFHPDREPSQLVQAVITMADMMEGQQIAAFDRLVDRLPTNAELPDTFARIASEVFFSDQVRDDVFWARLLAVMVFADRVALQCVRTEAGNYVWPIAVSLTRLIVEQLRPQMERLGGWDAFITYSRIADQAPHPTSSGGSRLRRFLSNLASAASKMGGEYDSQASGPASPQPLVSTIGWIAAPLAIGGAIYSALTNGN